MRSLVMCSNPIFYVPTQNSMVTLAVSRLASLLLEHFKSASRAENTEKLSLKMSCA